MDINDVDDNDNNNYYDDKLGCPHKIVLITKVYMIRKKFNCFFDPH